MGYICINCHKETISFNCNCDRDKKVWDSSSRVHDKKKANRDKNTQKLYRQTKKINK